MNTWLIKMIRNVFSRFGNNEKQEEKKQEEFEEVRVSEAEESLARLRRRNELLLRERIKRSR